ncbi:hypothetical protein RBG61_08250 [Paludicola sp. MB14-C6]|uniref:hypothetical protein n=1 Tax=Paludihabitans sp. MB14-C6 TaxID=3070656 RepID=UPI0027DBA6F2|nr:hypothetical protein [Paludicola sp. MB14-C6]WMJ21990.1 hypothetical protein RBG61_08250 [Paludicola sp. MB14-C6]
MKTFEQEYIEQMEELDIIHTTICSQNENNTIPAKLDSNENTHFGYQPTPEYTDTFCISQENHYSLEQLEKLMLVQQAKHIRTIKNSLLFFIATSFIILILSFLLGISGYIQ